MIKHKGICLSINGKQSVKLEEGISKFENYFKQIPVPFQIYADFECNLRKVECNEGSSTENIRTIFLVVLLIKLFVLMINLLIQLLYIETKMQLMNLLKQFLKNINIAKKTRNKHFNKNLIMTEEEYLFQKSNNCLICKNLLIMIKTKLEIIVM